MSAPISALNTIGTLPRTIPSGRDRGQGASKNRTFFFDLQAEHFTPDRHGMQFPNVEAAAAYALTFIRELYALSKGKVDLTSWIEIISNEGKLLRVINFYDACGMSYPKGRNGLSAKIV